MLVAVRQEIHCSGSAFHRLRQAPELLRYFPAGPDTTGPQLSRPPRGHSAADPAVARRRLKTFGIGRFYPNAEVQAALAAARPLVDFLVVV